jgi:nucleoside diphosphate kinase
MNRLVGEIIARFEKRGFKLIALQQMSPSQVCSPGPSSKHQLTVAGAPREALRRPCRQGFLQGTHLLQ